MSSEDKKCPMCGESVGVGNDLQLHYLTRCKGYDKKDDVPGESVKDPAPSEAVSLTKKESKREASGPKARAESSHQPRETDATVAHQPATYLVTFLWRPLTPLTFKKVTLLSHFQVEMKLDAQNGYYISDVVEVSEGEFDGQVVFGHSYCYALKKFVIDKSSTMVVLELDVSKMTEAEPEDSATGGYYYSTAYSGDTHSGSTGINLQSNPAYSYSRDPYGSSTMAGDVYGTHSTQYLYEGDKPASTQVHYCPVHKCFHPVETQPRSYRYNQPEDLPRLTEHEFLPPVDDAKDDSYSQKLSEEGFAPAAVKSKTSSRSRASQLDSRKYQDASYTTSSTYSYKPSYSTSPLDITTPSYTYSRGSVTGGGKYGTGTSPTNSPGSDITINPLRTKNVVNPTATADVSSSYTSAGLALSSAGSHKSTSMGSSSTGSKDRDSSSKTAVVKDMFTVSEIQSGDGDPKALKMELAQVARDRDSLKQSLERVSAQWEGRVKRLQDKLKQLQQGEGGGNMPMDALADVEEISQLQVQLQEAKDELSEKDRILADKEKELSECKDRVTALEDQLIEYATTIQDQTKGVMSMQTKYSAFAETIAMLERKVSRVDLLEAENATLQQSAQILTSDLKDNQLLIRQLTASIKEKEEEIRQLQQSSGSVGKHAEALELETMRQKYEAWMKTAEDLTNENEILKGEIRKVEEEQDSLNATVEALQHQLQSCQEECATKQSDRDILEARFAELQEIRMQQERDLTLLRSERAGILQQSAELSEASKPEKYHRLKKENSQLQSQRKDLLAQLEEAQKLVKVHQDKNVELQHMLEEASNPAKLRLIEQKMTKYRQEREQAKEELRSRQATEEERWRKDQEHQAMTEMMQRELETGRVEMSRLAVKLESMAAKRKQYKDECRHLQQMVDSMHRQLEDKEMEVSSLQQQIEQLTGAITEQVDNHFSGEEQDTLTGVYVEKEDKMTGTSMLGSYPDVHVPLSYAQGEFASSEPNLSTRNPNQEPFKPSQHQGSREFRSSSTAGLSKSRVRQNQTSVTASFSPHTAPPSQTQSPRSFDDLSHGESDMFFPVMTADGLVTMELRKPLRGVKKHTRVVVKRDTGQFVMGTLLYVGKPDRKEMAGVELDIERTDYSQSTPHDGTFKNGERYFQCSPGYGIYTPLGNIFVPVHQL